jgi:predicted nuclease of restriction endonuclease-like (RecB) superfamily
MKGFSARNLKYMRAFAEAWPDPAIVQQAVVQLPWGHSVRILDKTRTPEERSFYVAQALEHGWSRNVLVVQIESGLYHRQGRAITNFDRTLPPPDSDLASQALKDPYVFDFLELAGEVRERELERTLVEHIRSFLLELGVGFAFVGHQVHLEVGGEDFYLDMLFYHLRLRCYVVVELKTGEFRPEYAGKMNFYLSAVDDLLRHPDDGATVGLLLCKSKNRIVVEYALRDTAKPIGVSSWQLTRALPEDLSSDLPAVEVLEAELSESAGQDDDDGS